MLTFLVIIMTYLLSPSLQVIPWKKFENHWYQNKSMKWSTLATLILSNGRQWKTNAIEGMRMRNDDWLGLIWRLRWIVWCWLLNDLIYIRYVENLCYCGTVIFWNFLSHPSSHTHINTQSSSTVYAVQLIHPNRHSILTYPLLHLTLSLANAISN